MTLHELHWSPWQSCHGTSIKRIGCSVDLWFDILFIEFAPCVEKSSMPLKILQRPLCRTNPNAANFMRFTLNNDWGHLRVRVKVNLQRNPLWLTIPVYIYARIFDLFTLSISCYPCLRRIQFQTQLFFSNEQVDKLLL